jgi:methionyl-tRNA formyltransferase
VNIETSNLKIIIFSGSHARHLFVQQAVINSGADCAAVVMQRESIPSTPSGVTDHDKRNFEEHFRVRKIVESRYFGDLLPQAVFSRVPVFYCDPTGLNSVEVAKFVKSFAPDLAFIFGTDLIKDPVLSSLPRDRINLHLGLSPWYRGSATLFWPFYFLQPQFAGATFHQIIPEADAGQILHQLVPSLARGDGIHDVAAKTVLASRTALERILERWLIKGLRPFRSQMSSGRLFRVRDFQPAHLRIIYDLFDNRIVDAYLDGALEQTVPSLVDFFVS